MTTTSLQGLRIMVTRPRHQAAHLCDLIRAAGGVPISFPVLDIAEPSNPDAARAMVERLDGFDIAIFISTNAATLGMNLIDQHGGLPSHLLVAAVGARTSQALLEAGGRVDIEAPSPYNSEALLSTPEMRSVRGKHIVIFRGEGGREMLKETLERRGATVNYAEVYRREKPEAGLTDILTTAGEMTIIVVTSQEGLRNLIAMADSTQRRPWLLQQQLAVISERVAVLAQALGFHHPPLVAAQASDEALLSVITAWRHRKLAAQ